MRVILAKMFTENAIPLERYEGDQSLEELIENLSTYQNVTAVDQLFGRGTVERINRYPNGFSLVDDPVVRKHPKAVMRNLDDLARLKTESLRAVKEDRLQADFEAQKNANPKHKRTLVNAFEEDDWRPDEILVAVKGTGNWSSRILWRRLVDGEWVDVDPVFIMIRDNPELAKEYFDRLKGKTAPKKKTTKTKGKKTEPVAIDPEPEDDAVNESEGLGNDELDSPEGLLDTEDDGFGAAYEFED